MKRDIEKMISQGRDIIHKNERLDLTALEVNKIREMAKEQSVNETMFNLIGLSYQAGLAVGYRNRKEGA